MPPRLPSMLILGYCPECGCETLDAVPPHDPPPKVVCADCGHASRRPRDPLYRIRQKNTTIK